MTVFEYFDYEKQLVEDLKIVHTQCAKDAIYDSILKVLDDHKKFILNMMKEFDVKTQENAKHLAQAYRGETPDYVKKRMAEFGFHEPEEVSDAVPASGKIFLNIEKLFSASQLKDPYKPCDIVETYKENHQCGLSADEADAQNAKIMTVNDPASAALSVDFTMVPINEIFKDHKEDKQVTKKNCNEQTAKKRQKKPASKKCADAKSEGKLG